MTEGKWVWAEHNRGVRIKGKAPNIVSVRYAVLCERSSEASEGGDDAWQPVVQDDANMVPTPRGEKLLDIRLPKNVRYTKEGEEEPFRHWARSTLPAERFKEHYSLGEAVGVEE